MAGASQVLVVDIAGESKLPNGRCILVNDSNLPIFSTAKFLIAGTTYNYVGAQTTRDTVRAEVGTAGAIGSTYQSTAGKLYLKVANADATTDWQKVTATAAD